MGDIISGIFGGGKQDDSAAKIAQAQMEAEREARAQEQARWQSEQDRVSKDKMMAEQKATQEEEKRKKDLELARVENQKQIEAQKATGQGATFENTRTDAAKAIAANAAGGVQLPGYKQLSALAAQPGAYQGQQNAIVSPTGFNTQKVGGRRYV